MKAVTLPLLGAARADIAIPQAPPLDAVPADLPPPTGPRAEPSPVLIASISLGLGLVLVAGLWWGRRGQN